jgi:hypothetical protein
MLEIIFIGVDAAALLVLPWEGKNFIVFCGCI